MSSPTDTAERTGRPRLALGSVIAARYVVRDLLGEGGGGQVYRARDRVLDRDVAIKLLHAHRWRSPRAIARMRRETALAQTITHPCVCRVYDFGIGSVEPAAGSSAADGVEDSAVDDVPYLSMELLRGETLARRVERDGPLAPAAAVAVAQQIARALAAAHRAGIVHGDVKPSNVMLVGTGEAGCAASDGAQRVVLTDFGLSRVTSVDPAEIEAAAHDTSDATTSPDTSSLLAGTPLCLAPEQVLGQPLTEATDAYSFGVVLYYVLSGSWPFTGGSRVAVAMARLEREPEPLVDRCPELGSHGELVTLVEACLRRNPQHRPNGMDDVLDRLAACRSEPLGVRRNGRRLGQAAIAGVVLLGLTWWFGLRPGPEEPSPVAVAGSIPRAYPVPPLFGQRAPIPGPIAPSSPAARAPWEAGLAALEAGDPSTAIRQLEAAREATADANALVWMELSRAWQLAGNQRRSLEAAEQAFDLRGQLPRGEQLLAEARLRVAQSDWKRAATVLRALWEFYPDRSRYGYELAGVLDRDGRLEEAKAVIGEVRERFGRDSAHLDLREALIEYHLGDYARSAEHARSAATLAAAAGARLLEAEAFDLEALTRLHTETDLDEIEALLREAESIFREVGHLAKVASVNRRLGHLARRRGAFDAAERHYQTARSLARESEDPATFAGATGDLALLLDSRGRIETALELKHEVLANYEQRGIRQGAAITQENIGISLFKLGRLESAMSAMRAAEEEYDELGDRVGLAWAPYYQGRVWARMGRIELAQRSFDIATAAAAEVEDATLASYIRYEEAELEWMRGRFESALALNRACKETYRSAQQARDVADADLQAARIYAAMGRWPDTTISARLALAGYAELGIEQGVVESRAMLVLALLEEGESAEAREHFEELRNQQTEHGPARLRAAAAVAVAQARLRSASASPGTAEQTAAVLDELRRESLELELIPLASEIGLFRLELLPDPALERELRAVAADRELQFILNRLPLPAADRDVTDRAGSTVEREEQRAHAVEAGATP